MILGTLLLGSATLIQTSLPGVSAGDAFFRLIGLTYALSIVYLATLRFVDRQPWLADAQLFADAMLVSAFIHVTGGIASDFASLYLLPIIAASTIRFRRGALQVAALSAALYLVLVTTQYVDVSNLPVWHVMGGAGLPAVRVAQYIVTINLVSFFAVALLAGSLAEGLRSAGARLVHASAAIADLRAFNEHVINSLVSGLVTADTDGRILTFNRAAAAITSVPVPTAVGRHVGDVLGLPAPFRGRLGDLGETRGERIDFEYRTGDGRQIELGVTGARLAFPDGRIGYLFTFQDVTDVKKLERDAGRRQRLAAVGEMAAGIAHEIRNPLASMSGSMQVLRAELPLNEEQEQLMDIVLRESDRLNQTIRSFLAYARPQPSNIARFDVGQVMGDTALLLRNSSDVREDHVVDVNVPAEPVWHEADANQIRQIVWNLATNGLRSMSDGGRLLLSARNEPALDGDGDLVITVQDEGCGIPANEIDHIFQPFHSAFAKGTGLGLATVHRIVTDYNGVIQVASQVGVGTTVRVRLPIRAKLAASIPSTEVIRTTEGVAV